MQRHTLPIIHGGYAAVFFYALFCFSAVRVSPRESAIVLSASWIACTYLFVVDSWECPSRAATCLILAPFSSESVADVCRRAWNLMCFRSCRWRKSLNCSVGVFGCITEPSALVNTKLSSWPFQAVPSLNRLSICSIRNCRSSSVQ